MQLGGLIVKVAGRCNINCRYCYMYNRADQSYRRLPKVMSSAVAEALIQRAWEHCTAKGSETFEFVFHGGEPLLAPPSFYVSFVEHARKVFGHSFRLRFAIQTNGTLLSPSWCELLERLRIRVSLSIDGDSDSHNRNRVDFKGYGTYEATIRGLRLAQQYPFIERHLGLLAVVDVSAPPLGVYRSLYALGVRQVNLLLPDVTHDEAHWKVGVDTLYADWLITVFDEWFHQPQPKPRIPLFTRLIQLILGYACSDEMLGKGVFNYLVVETDGSIEPLDVLKICGDSFTLLGLSVLEHGLDDALQTELGQRSYYAHHELSLQCRQCLVVDVCGGGYLPHRYQRDTRFDNPTVYCHDMLKLISHVQNALLPELPASLRRRLTPLDFQYLLTTLTHQPIQSHAQ